MKLLNEENDILLIQSTKAENELLRDVLKASLDFDPAMWDGLEEEDVRDLIRQAENRIEQEEFTVTRDEFHGFYGILLAAAYAVNIQDYGIEDHQAVKDLTQQNKKILHSTAL